MPFLYWSMDLALRTYSVADAVDVRRRTQRDMMRIILQKIDPEQRQAGCPNKIGLLLFPGEISSGI
jgi:hypothetical protein